MSDSKNCRTCKHLKLYDVYKLTGYCKKQDKEVSLNKKACEKHKYSSLWRGV